MPVGFTIRPDFEVMVALFHGVVSVNDIRHAFKEYQRDPAFDGRYCVLMDLAYCSFPDDHFDDYRQLAHSLRPHYATRDAQSRTSFFAPGDVAYGMSRMYQSIAEGKAGYSIEVFRTAKEALRFARIDPEAPGAADLLRPG